MTWDQGFQLVCIAVLFIATHLSAYHHGKQRGIQYGLERKHGLRPTHDPIEGKGK